MKKFKFSWIYEVDAEGETLEEAADWAQEQMVCDVYFNGKDLSPFEIEEYDDGND